MDPNFEPPVSSASPSPAPAPGRSVPVIVRVVRVVLLIVGLRAARGLAASGGTVFSLAVISTGAVLLAGAMLFVIPARRSTHLFVSGVLAVNAASAGLTLWEFWPDFIQLSPDKILSPAALALLPVVLLILYAGSKSSREFAGYGQDDVEG